MKKYLATVYYRTKTTCNTVMFDVKCDNHEVAVVEVRKKFSKQRPKAIRIDQIDIVEHKA